MLVLRTTALALFAVATTLAAHADNFNFSYTGTDANNMAITASGTLTGNATSPGVYLITGITGSRNGVTISGLDMADPFADQMLYFPGTDTGTALTPTYLDNNGIAFFAAGTDYNIFTSVTRPAVVENDLGPAINLTVSRATAVTPEPSTLALLGTGFVGVAGAARRRLRCS